MTNGVSKHLKKVMKDINAKLRKEDVMGIVLLADGKKSGEFGLFIDVPEWSNIRFVHKEDGSVVIHTKVHMKSSKEHTERTINGVYNLKGMLEHVYSALQHTVERWNQVVDIEEEKGKIIPIKKGDE